MRPLRALVIATVLLLSGCVAAPTAEPIDAPTPTAKDATSPTPSPTPSVSAEGIVAFGGDCDNVLDQGQVEAILGAGAMTLAEWRAIYQPDLTVSVSGPLERAGGINCRWMAAEGAEGLPEGMTEIAVLAMPVDAAGEAEIAALAEARCDPQYDASSCRLGRTSGATWLMARAGGYLETPPNDLLLAALDAAESNLSAYPAPVAAAQEASWWDIRDCVELGKAIDLAEFLGPDYNNGYWEGSPQHEDFLLEAAGVGQFCQWSSNSSAIPEGEQHYIVSLTLEPGGAWRWPDVVAAEDFDAAEAAGADDAVRRIIDEEDSNPNATTWATEGTNVLSVQVQGGLVDIRIAERVLADMG